MLFYLCTGEAEMVMNWLVKIGETEYNAESTEELREWFQGGRIGGGDYVFHPLLQKWFYAKDLEELKGIEKQTRTKAPNSLVAEVLPATAAKGKISDKWVEEPTWICILSFAAGAVFASLAVPVNYHSAWVTLEMLIVVTLCMVTSRGDWKLWQRIGFIPLSWILQAIISIPVGFVLGAVLPSLGAQSLTNISVAFIAALPIVGASMEQSRLFVRRQ